MREPYTQLYVHLVWATWDRLPILSPALRELVYKCVKAECRDLRAEVLAIGGTHDHVHLLVRIPTTVPICVLVKQVKGSSAHLANRAAPDEGPLKWQGAYGAFTVSKALVPTVAAYVMNQERHHEESTTDRDLEICWDESPPVAGVPDLPAGG